MNPNELRELAERVDVAESTGDWDSCELSAAYLREQADRQEQSTPIGWIEGPHGALRANPDYRFQGPQTVAWSFPLYLHPAPQSVPAGWSAPGPVDSDHPLECLIVLPALRQSDGDRWVSGDHFYAQDTPLAWLPDTNGSRAMIAASPAAPVEVVKATHMDVAQLKDLLRSGAGVGTYLTHGQAWEIAEALLPKLAALAAADQRAAMQRATDVAQDLGLYEAKEPK